MPKRGRASEDEDNDGDEWAPEPGEQALLRDLASAPELNGERVRVEGLDKSTGRWAVVLVKDGRTIKVLSSKLEAAPRAGVRKKAASSTAPPSSSSASSKPTPTSVLVWAVSWAFSTSSEKELLEGSLEVFGSEREAMAAFGRAVFSILSKGDCEGNLFAQGRFGTECESCQSCFDGGEREGECGSDCGNVDRVKLLKRGDVDMLEEAGAKSDGDGGFVLNAMLETMDQGAACDVRVIRKRVPIAK